MRKLIVILVLLSVNVFGQRPSKANAIILAYAEQNLGKKVGDGVCRTLTNEAIFAYRKTKNNNTKKVDYAYGFPCSVIKDTAKWSAGDFVYFEEFYLDHNETEYIYIAKHIGIVKSVDKDKITFYNQNVLKVGETTKKNSKVQVDTVYFNKVIQGKMDVKRIY
jgi:hypothetical protein